MSFKEDPMSEEPPGANEQTSGGSPAEAPQPQAPAPSGPPAGPPPPPVGAGAVSADEEIVQLGEGIEEVAPVAAVDRGASVPVQDEPVGAAAAAPAGEPTATAGSGEAKRSPGGSSTFVKVLWLVLAAAIFGAGGYWIAPREADSAQVDQQASQLAQAQANLGKAQAELRKLKTEMTASEAELAELKQQADRTAEAETDASCKVAASETRISELSEQLKEARTANEPMIEKLAAAEKRAAEGRGEADKAKGLGEKLQTQLAAVTKKREALAAERKTLLATKAALSKDLTAQVRAAADLKRLLDVLDMGRMPESSPPAGPAEMPITIQELTRAMGHPTLTVQENDQLEMRWGADHKAMSSAGVVVSLDGEPATRGQLAKVATVPPGRTSTPAAWRLTQGEKVTYAELVEMFGQPDRLAGKGSHFKAWWSVGAWARTASATVVNGVVTSFDGKAVKPAELCSLVAQRAQAYRQGAASTAVQAAVASAKVCYRHVAETLLPQKLRQEAALKARDGLALTKWTLAPFDSVGTWIARTDAPVAGAMTMRAAVDCVWTAGDGSSTLERRYVVLTLAHDKSGEVRTTDYAILQGRD